MKKGLLLINNKVEDGESLFTRALLIRSGYIIDTATLENSLNIETAYNLAIKADFFIKDMKASDYDFLIIPGGGHVFDWVNKADDLNKLIEDFNDQKKLISAICAAPLLLNDTTVLTNKEYTIFTGLENKVSNATYIRNEKVVVSDNIITSRSAGTIYDFVFAIIKYLDGDDVVKTLKESIIY